MKHFKLFDLIIAITIALTQLGFAMPCESAILHNLINKSDSVKTKSKETLTIPEGTRLMVKLDKPISTAKDGKGSVVTAVLDIDLVVESKVIAPKGSKVYGKVIESRGGKVLGGQKLIVQFTDVMINNQLTPILTDPIGVETGAGKTVKKVGAGALIGSAFGGSKGAGKGALIAGGLSLLSARGNHIQIPAGTIAEIPLRAPMTVHKLK
jgi:ribosomal protein L18E